MARKARGRKGGRHQAAARREAQRAGGLALAFGVLGLVVCGLTAPIAILYADSATKAARGGRIPVPGSATAGLVLGVVGCIGIGLAILAVAIGEVGMLRRAVQRIF